jgi:hypothetical protein
MCVVFTDVTGSHITKAAKNDGVEFSPLDGLSEYLVQKTQAGQSCPFGPRTIPGGRSSFPESLEGLASPSDDDDDDDLEDRSTGWLLFDSVGLFDSSLEPIRWNVSIYKPGENLNLMGSFEKVHCNSMTDVFVTNKHCIPTSILARFNLLTHEKGPNQGCQIFLRRYNIPKQEN